MCARVINDVLIVERNRDSCRVATLLLYIYALVRWSECNDPVIGLRRFPVSHDKYRVDRP